MKIVIAPDSYKESLSAHEAAIAIREGVYRVDKEIETVLVPMSDGGEGTVHSLIEASQGNIVEVSSVHDPLTREIVSFYGIMGNGKTAVIEMSAASGLSLLAPEERNPLKTTSLGTGELIKDALDKGCKEIILGLGGSATNDGGVGMAGALGIRFLDENGREINAVGEELSRIRTIDFSDIDKRIQNTVFKAACDVDNPLCGSRGASEVYGRQKGADDHAVKTLDHGLEHLANILTNSQKIDKRNVPGAGAAGGMGYGIMVFFNGTLESGINIVIDSSGLSNKMDGADLVITGEGKIDDQTASGKTPLGVARLAKQKGIPVVALAGSLGKNYKTLYDEGFDGIFSIIDTPVNLQEAIENANELLKNTTEAILRLWLSKVR